MKDVLIPSLMDDSSGMLKGPFQDLLVYKRNVFSQNGEDGIIKRIFEVIGIERATCCEFGAWDGIHLSNCRQLILQGWKGIMIEGDPTKYRLLAQTYAGTSRVQCVNAFVDGVTNKLSRVASGGGVSDLDFLSIDIDGLDYEILDGLDVMPRVICIEVNAGHNPLSRDRLPRRIAKDNVGQPLGVFSEVANAKGYGLVCYTGNAFYVRNDILKSFGMTSKSDLEAYTEFLETLSLTEREWLYLVGKSFNPPYFKFCNPYLSGRQLRIPFFRRTALLVKGWPNLPRRM